MFEVFQAAYSHAHATREINGNTTIVDECIRAACELAQHRPTKPLAGDKGPTWRPCHITFYADRFRRTMLARVHLTDDGFVYVAPIATEVRSAK